VLLLLCVTDKPHPLLVDMIPFIATIHHDQHSLDYFSLQRGGVMRMILVRMEQTAISVAAG
jgi:hypothetical protein